MNYLNIALVIVVVIGIISFITMKRENFSDYNAPNDFMKIYYSNIAQDPAFDKKFPFFGTKDKAGLRCRFPNNKGCSTIWLSGQLVELTPKLKKKLTCLYGIKFTDD